MTLPGWLRAPLRWALAILAGIGAALMWRAARDRRVIADDRREQARKTAMAEAEEVAARTKADAAAANARADAEPGLQAAADAAIADAARPVESAVTPDAAAEAQAVSDELLRRQGKP